MQRQIPEVVVSLLPMYVRGLAELHQDGIDFINSKDLGWGIVSGCHQTRLGRT